VLSGAGAYFIILSSFWLNHFVFSMVSGDVGQNRIVYTLSALIVSYCTDGLRHRNLPPRMEAAEQTSLTDEDGPGMRTHETRIPRERLAGRITVANKPGAEKLD
jgi:hypothetical protein